ncbi:Methylcytosine dioxygenase TET3 [Armadillidium vulgare]|nr:Methylcytosine dioxygenase TET3 [Armadillidium vulgare]
MTKVAEYRIFSLFYFNILNLHRVQGGRFGFKIKNICIVGNSYNQYLIQSRNFNIVSCLEMQDPGPIYTHLGSGATLGEVRKNIEERTGHVGPEIIRRSGPEEKVLVVVKNRVHHTCNSSWIVVVIVAWDGMSQEIADDLYTTLVHKLNKFGNPTERRCGTNEDRTCFCQGIEQDKCGSSFSFGCSWSMYYNMCKFARSKHTRKFKLTDEKEEQEVEEKLQRLATEISPVYKRFVPDAYYNQVALEDESLECRLGNEKGRPWTGVTACLDFCAHCHKDNHNMNNGCTVVATLTKHRGFSKPDDEQYHVLPLYILDPTDEEGGYDGFHKKVNAGSLEVLTKYPCEIRLRAEPLLSCRARSLLARGLPLPNSHRNKLAKGKSKVKGSIALANLRRKSSEGDNLAKKKKSEVKEVTDKLGLDVDLTSTKNNDGEETYEDLSKYNIESDDYSWLLDFGNDHTDGDRKKGASLNKEEMNKEGSKLEGSQLQTLGQSENGMTVSHSFSVPSGVNGSLNRTSPLVSEGIGQSSSMPPPPSPAPKRPLSPSGNMSPFSSSQTQQTSSPSPTLSPLSSPFLNSGPPIIHPQSPHNSQSPIESSLNTSSPSNFSSVSHFSPFSPPMPSLSPHGMQSSPSSPGRNVQNSNVSTTNATASMLSNVSQAQNIPVVSTPGSLFTISHNSPEMPRLSPHITLSASQIPGLNKSGDKPISGLALVSQPSSASQLTSSMTGNSKIENSNFEKVSSSTEATEATGDKKQSVGSGQVVQNQSEINMDINTVGDNNNGEASTDGEKNPLTYVSFSENLDNFQNPDIGGVSIALSHRSVLFEYAKHELHATTALKVPDRRDPKRVSLIFYHHKSLIYRNHGWSELEKKMEKKKLEVEKLAKEGKVKPPPKKKKKPTKSTAVDKSKDIKLEGGKGPPNGIKRMKFDPKVEQQQQTQSQQPQETHPSGMVVDHKKGHLLSGKPATVYPTCNPTIPHHSDLISPPISYANYPRSLPSFVESTRPFSPSAQRNSAMTPSFSLPSKSPHLITSQSPTLDQHQQKPNPTPDHSYISSHLNHIPGGGVPPPFNTSLQEFNPYNTPGSSPYHNHFSPYVDVQGNPNFPSYQSGNFFSKGPAPPLNYNTTTYVPQPFYGLTPPYSPGPQQPQQIPPHHPHHLQSQIPGPFPHGGLPPNMPSSLSYEDTLGRGPASQPTSTWSQMRHVPSFHVHGPYAPWPGS